MTDKLENDELREMITTIQIETKLDDTQWEEKFGNKKGLLGCKEAINAHTIAVLEQIKVKYDIK